MEFVPYLDGEPPAVLRIGAVQYVAYRQMWDEPKVFALFPNGARCVGNGFLLAAGDTPQEAWRRCVKRDELMAAFGVDSTERV